MVVEMVSFCILVLPLPTAVRRRYISFFSNNEFIKSIQVGLKFTFFFILILFVDSVNRVYRVQQELAATHESSVATAVVSSDRSEIQARRFYAQRNMYLCGFTLFLSLILNRTYVLVEDLVATKDKYTSITATSKTGSTKTTGKAGSEKEYQDEIARLNKIIEKKDIDIKVLKEQAQGLSKEYNNISDQLNTKSGVSARDKKND